VSLPLHLDPQRLDAVCEAIANTTQSWLARHRSEQRHEALERRRTQIGGMLELARRLSDHRLARFLEAHKDALSRLIEAD
jgi:hypothetical protein